MGTICDVAVRVPTPCVDSANIEIRDAIGKENMFIFGALAQDVNDLRERVRAKKVDIDPRFNEVMRTCTRFRYAV
jgi:glucan phosphorylase